MKSRKRAEDPDSLPSLRLKSREKNPIADGAELEGLLWAWLGAEHISIDPPVESGFVRKYLDDIATSVTDNIPPNEEGISGLTEAPQ